MRPSWPPVFFFLTWSWAFFVAAPEPVPLTFDVCWYTKVFDGMCCVSCHPQKCQDPGFPGRILHCSEMISVIHFNCQWLTVWLGGISCSNWVVLEWLSLIIYFIRPYIICVSKLVHNTKRWNKCPESYHKSNAVKCTWISELFPLCLSSKMWRVYVHVHVLISVRSLNTTPEHTICAFLSGSCRLLGCENGEPGRCSMGLQSIFCLQSAVTEPNSPSFGSNNNGFGLNVFARVYFVSCFHV